MRLTSAGAAGTVTGSCHLLEARGRRILVDCGMFQGRDVEPLNRAPFPFEVRDLDAVLVTHGHLDHVGRLPILLRQGYRGPFYATAATRAVTEVILLDSAKLQASDHERALRRRREPPISEDVAREKGRPGHGVEEPLYDVDDVAATLERFREVGLDAPLDLGEGVTATYRPAGHILGSAFIEIDTPDGRIVFSGDLGNRESGIHKDFVLPTECDAVVVETTYGDRTHRSLNATIEEFEGVLRKAVEECGIVLIPTFALERAQAILYHLKTGMNSGRIPRLPIILDSPMAAKMTDLYQSCANEFIPEVAAALRRGEDPFEPESLTYAVTPEDSKRVNTRTDCAIVMAGSGMMTGGRIVHHLKFHLAKESTHVVVVGYQAQGTLGRRLVERVPRVRIHGREIDVLASIHTINGFSAHADQDDLLAWLEPTGGADVYMVHGEPPVMGVFARTLEERGRRAIQVERGKPYDLT